MAQLLNSVDGVKKRADLGPPRWFLPLTVGILTFGFVWAGQEPPGVYADFDYLWASGAAVWHGLDPHAYVQEQIAAGRLLSPFYYPGTAAVLMAPFGALSRHLAVSLFTALGMGLLTLQWPYFLVLVYLPALYLVLRP